MLLFVHSLSGEKRIPPLQSTMSRDVAEYRFLNRSLPTATFAWRPVAVAESQLRLREDLTMELLAVTCLGTRADSVASRGVDRIAGN
jgi:hypothetical protein